MLKKILDLFGKDWMGIVLGGALFVPALIFEHLGFAVLSLVLYCLALLGAGYSVFIDAVKGILRRDLLDEKFLMSISSIGAMVISEYSEGVAVMLFFLVGEFFEHRAVRRSRRAIKSLTSLCPDTATVLADGEESELDADELEAGMIMILRSGDRIAADCRVIEGGASVDKSMLTGEALPISCGAGDELQSGAIVVGGALKCEVLRSAEQSCASRILELVENASDRKAREESFITSFSRVYTPVVCILALLMATVPPAFDLVGFTDALYRALSFLVVSCPCALVISVPMAFFGGIGGAASTGILFKGGNIFSPVSRARTAVFDKTGTITDGSFSVVRIEALGIEREELCRLVSSVERRSLHPLAVCLAGISDEFSEPEQITEHAGEGIVGTVEGRQVAVGNRRLMERIGVVPADDDATGVLFISVDTRYSGFVQVSDRIKQGAKDAITRLKGLGIKSTYMLSGDNRERAESVAKEVGIDKAYSELLPEDKYNLLENIISESDGAVIYVGDGINDAPSLARADVGIAMGGIGSDSAIEAADAVIVSDDITRICDMITVARRTNRIAKENIVLALGIKLGVIGLISLGFGSMWLAVFADVGVAVLAILNSMRTLLVKKNAK